MAGAPSDDGLSSSFWDRRHPCLGVPVGCLLVPRQHVCTVQISLKAEGKAARPSWLRPHGTLPYRRSESEENNEDLSLLANDKGVYEIHVTIFAATLLERGNYEEIPLQVRELLLSQQIRWKPGARLSNRRGGDEQIPDCITSKLAMRPRNSKTANDKPPLFSFCELFAGIGGFRLALEQLGGQCVFSSEIDKSAASTYALNFGTPPTAGDITTVEAVKDIPDHVLLVGGFPCQSFSTAGHQQGLDDSETNGRLYLEVCRVLCAKRPQVFLLENVANLYTINGGSFHEDPQQRTPGRAFATIQEALERSGYYVQARILSAHHYGVPQHRDRLFIVGFLEWEAAERFRWPSPTTSSTATVNSILEPHDCVAVLAAALTPSQYSKVSPYLSDAAGRACRAVRLDGIARTLMASYRAGWHKHSELVVTPINSEAATGARFYTAREAARLMGFNDLYNIPGYPTREHGGKAYDVYQRNYHLLGNAVCPPVVQAVAACILEALGISVIDK